MRLLASWVVHSLIKMQKQRLLRFWLYRSRAYLSAQWATRGPVQRGSRHGPCCSTHLLDSATHRTEHKWQAHGHSGQVSVR